MTTISSRPTAAAVTTTAAPPIAPTAAASPPATTRQTGTLPPALAPGRADEFVGPRATPVDLGATPRVYPDAISHGWDPVTGRTLPTSGQGRISQDPANPFRALAGEVGARTGATFIQVIPSNPNHPNPARSIEFANAFAQGGPYSDVKPPGNAPSGVILSDFSGRVHDYKTYGSERDVANLLKTSASPEAYAAGLDRMGGFVSGNGAYNAFGVTQPLSGASKQLAPEFAMGNYTQVATYLAANPDVAAMAKQHPTVHPHVVAEWHFEKFGRGEGRQWPQEVTLLPNFNNVVGYASSGNDAFSEKALRGYVERNPDVRALAQQAGEPELAYARRHYDAVGRLEGRSMGPRNYGTLPGGVENPHFERYYRGEMNEAEKRLYFAGELPVPGSAPSSPSPLRGGDGGPVRSSSPASSGAALSPAHESELRQHVSELRSGTASDTDRLLEALASLLSRSGQGRKANKLIQLLKKLGLSPEEAQKVLKRLGVEQPAPSAAHHGLYRA